nr:uncharacterized protein LOC101787316 isoform X5 [Cavia porcellus]
MRPETPQPGAGRGRERALPNPEVGVGLPGAVGVFPCWLRPKGGLLTLGRCWEQEPYSAPYLSKDAVGREENICKNQATSLEHSRNAFNWKMPAHLGERRPVEVSFLRKDFTSESMQLTWTLLSLQDLELPQGDMAHSLSQLAIFISWDQVSSRSHKPRAAVGPSVWSKAAWRSIQQKGRKRKRLN